MPLVQYNDICDIFYRSHGVPAGVFDADGTLVYLSSGFGQRLTGMYLQDSSTLLADKIRGNAAEIRPDEHGSCWCIISADGTTVLLGPVQTGRNPDFPYDRIPEFSPDSFSDICTVFARILLGKDTEVIQNGRLRAEHYTASLQFRAEQEDFELLSFDEMFQCVKLGDIEALNTYLHSQKYIAYNNRVMNSITDASHVFLFCLAKTYHTAAETGIPIRDLTPLISIYLKQMDSCTSVASFKSAMQRMLYDFTRYVAHYRSESYSMPVNMALLYIREHVYSLISVEEIASHCSMSVSALQHRFKKETGHSISDAVLSYKIDKACFFLRYTKLPCTAIAFKLGYGSQSYFNRQFRKICGMTPSEYRSVS
ncbi:MAG: AraC family transcriptional regulator [Solobacterium sp.]|nr:AraC family transcriptional regulator [Solobacterium sp.]